MNDVTTAGKAVALVFNPDKINYGSYADKLSHLHMHIVPKYKDGYGFGGVFEMNPQKVFLSDNEYAVMTDKIAAALDRR